MFIEPLQSRPALQRSAMFPAIDRKVEHVSLPWSEEEPFGDAAIYKHWSLRDAETFSLHHHFVR